MQELAKQQKTQEQKDKKIEQLRDLLSQAKTKIQNLKILVKSKDKQLEQVHKHYEQSIKSLQNDSANIIKQYEERLLRYQKTMEDSEALVSKYQKQTTANNQSYKLILSGITQIGNLTTKVFTLNISKENSDAVEQLCNIQKCKEYLSEIQKIANQHIEPVCKAIKKLIDLYSGALSKKRQARLSLMKKQGQLKKFHDQQHDKVMSLQKEIETMKKQYKQKETSWQQKLEDIARSKAKISEQKTNQQFIKQLILKIIIGPKQASLMALQVLSKVLKFSQQEQKTCIKKIR